MGEDIFELMRVGQWLKADLPVAFFMFISKNAIAFVGAAHYK